jgi:hypothetical protein
MRGGDVERRHSWVSILVAVPGVIACLLALVGFFWIIRTNRLPFHPELTAMEYYHTVGRAYGSGFVVGFFFCFFLVLGVLGVSAIVDRRRRPRPVRPSARLREPIAFPQSGAAPRERRTTASDR